MSTQLNVKPVMDRAEGRGGTVQPTNQFFLDFMFFSEHLAESRLAPQHGCSRPTPGLSGVGS